MELQHYKTFTENTSQGIVGLLKPAKRAGSLRKNTLWITKTKFENSATDYFFVKDDPNYPIFVFKIAKEVNTLIDHEFAVSKDMEELSIYLPHFNRIYEVKFDVRCYIPENKVKKSSFDPFSQYNCIRDVAIIEYIPSKVTLLQYINDTSFGGSTSSLLYQTFLALFIAQQERRFTHYDLHLENILLRRCLTRTFFLYRFLFENVTMNRLIYTGGYFPVIFDYGFAYSKGLDNHTYKNSFFFTNKGYTSFMYDELTDFKTLLVRLASFDTCPSKIKTVADSLFLKSPNITFKLDKETGWIKSSALSAARIVSNKLLKTIKKLGYGNSFIYKESDAFIDLFSLLIKLPLEENVERENVSDSRWESAVETFLSEWTCIEKWFPDTVVDDKLNILKKIFQTTNNLLDQNINQQTPQGSGIDTLIGLADQGAQMDKVHLGRQFKLKLFDTFDMFGAFINVEMNYSKFLSSIVELSNYIEIILHHETRRYSELFEIPLTRWETMVKLEQIFQPTKPHKFEPNDNIVVFDCIEKCVVSFDLKDTEIIASLNTCCTVDAQIELLNSLPSDD